MKRIGVIAAALITLTLVGCSQPPQQPQEKVSTQDIINHNKFAVFLIHSQMDRIDPLSGQPMGGTGTGFLTGKNRIMTNAHVISGAVKVEVMNEFSPQPYEVKVIFKDEVADIAVLEIVDWDIYSKENYFKYLEFGDSSEIKSIDEVYAIGNPWGLLFSTSKGIISHVLQSNYDRPNLLIQVDADIYNGNSGGPLFNTEGEVIGVNSLMQEGPGGSYGFAIHSNIVQKIIKDWEEFGMVRWAFVGISIKNGMKIDSVLMNSAAAIAGIKKGDKIMEVRINGRLFVPEKPLEFNFLLNSAQYNDSFEIMVEREDGLHLIAVKPKYRLSSEYLK